ncbi:cohesin subunit SA-1-like [Oscarella lobularis]|uniref:cohesin subunit SA-1-like n=1 Tax=Oscarella lobularis TaxID=121494 RepID=UPI003313FED8
MPPKKAASKRKPTASHSSTKRSKKNENAETASDSGEDDPGRRTNEGGEKPSPRKRGKKSGGRTKVKLFDVVTNEKAEKFDVVLFGWFDKFEETRDEAVIEIVEFLLESCGWKGSLDIDEVYAEDIAPVIHGHVANVLQGPHPILSRGKPHKNFKYNLGLFVQEFVQQCVAKGMIDDDFFQETFLSWAIHLSLSACYPFRHTGTFIGLSIVTGLGSILEKKQTTAEQHESHLIAERAKSKKKVSSQRIEILELQIRDLNKDIETIMEIMEEVSTQILKHRTKDIRPDIRTTGVIQLGEWMVQCKEEFVQDKYLKYLGWALYDKSGDVRHETLAALLNVFLDPQNQGKLSDFTERFKDRLVEMLRDVDERVTLQAFEIVEQLMTFDPLAKATCDAIARLMLSAKPSRSHAAGRFFQRTYLSDDSVESWKEESADSELNCTDWSNEETALCMLVMWCEDHHSNTPLEYVVDSLWDDLPLLTDWKAMTFLLLEGGMQGPQEEILADIIRVCVIRATGGDPPRERRLTKKKPSRADERKIEETSKLMCQHFLKNLPDLIDKFAADEGVLQHLVAIPTYFYVDYYDEWDISPEKLWAQLKEAITKSSNSKVIDNACQSLVPFLKETAIAHFTAVTFCHEICTEAADDLKRMVTIEENLDESDLIPALHRVTMLLKYHYDDVLYCFDEFYKVLSSWSTLSEEIVELALFGANYALTWFVSRGALERRTVLDSIKVNTEKFVKYSVEIVKSGEEVSPKAFLSLVDYMSVYEKRMKKRERRPGDVSFSSDQPFEDFLLDFVESFSFSSDKNDFLPTQMTEEEVDEFHYQSEALAGLLRLQLGQVLSSKVAIFALKHNYKPYSMMYESIYKSLAEKLREKHPHSYYKFPLQASQMAYEEDPDSVVMLKDLGSNLASFLGDGVRLRQQSAREQIILFHRHSIAYALSNMTDAEAPDRLSFLNTAGMFTSRLLPIDKSGDKGVLPYLDARLSEEILSTLDFEEDLQPLRNYRLLLGAKEVAAEKSKSKAAKKTAKPTGVAGRKKKKKGIVARVGNAGAPKIGAPDKKSKGKRRGSKKGVTPAKRKAKSISPAKSASLSSRKEASNASATSSQSEDDSDVEKEEEDEDEGEGEELDEVEYNEESTDLASHGNRRLRSDMTELEGNTIFSDKWN